MDMQEVENAMQLLGRVARMFSPRAPERRVIKEAAEALFYVRSEKTRENFAKFMLGKKEGLTRAQELHLQAIGVDLDATTSKKRAALRARRKYKK